MKGGQYKYKLVMACLEVQAMVAGRQITVSADMLQLTFFIDRSSFSSNRPRVLSCRGLQPKNGLEITLSSGAALGLVTNNKTKGEDV